MKKKLKHFFVQLLLVTITQWFRRIENENVARQYQAMLQGLQGCRQIRRGIRQSLAKGQGWTCHLQYAVESGMPLLWRVWSHRQVLPKASQEQGREGKD